MKNFSVAKKLIASFAAIVLLFGILIASIIFGGMNSVSNYFNGFYTGPYPTVDTADKLNKDLHALEKYMLMMITTDDSKKAVEYEKEATSRSTTINEEIAALQKTLTLKSSKDKLNQLIQNSKTGQELNNKMIKLYENGDKEAAQKLYFSDYINSADASRDLSNAINDSSRTVAKQYYTDASQAASRAYAVIAVLIAVILACVLLLSRYIIRGITNPIKEIDAAMKKLSAGRLTTEVDYTSRDEFGSLADSVRTMIGRIKEYIDNIAYVTGAISHGDMSVSVGIDYQNDFAPIKESMEQILSSLNKDLSEISLSSQQVAAGSSQMSAGAQALSQGATEQASSVEELAASITEVSEKIEQNADNAKQANANMDATALELERGDAQMKQLTGAMDEIKSASEKIGNIIKAINDIAFQTNILSLNAAVEAARAGEAGKGFAVVADEVRNLAGKSAEAAKNTTSLIESTLAAVNNGSQMMTDAEKNLGRISEKAKAAYGLIRKIAQASEEQSNSIGQIKLGVNQISAVIQTNSATAEESAASSEELSAQAEVLKNLVSHFRLKDTQTA